MDHSSVWLAGALIGLAVAAPVGPMGVLCINRTLVQGFFSGISTGAGASTVHVVYCGLLLLGFHQFGPWLHGNGNILRLLGALVMLVFAWRLLRAQRRAGSGRRVGGGSLLVAYLSALAFNLLNPMTLVLLMGSLAAVFGERPPTGTETGLLLLGLFAGSVGWWICLSSVTALLRSRLNAGVLGIVNLCAATVLLGFGILSLSRLVLD